MGGPELKPVMHRTCRPFGPRSSTQPPGVGSWGPVCSRASAIAARFCSASGVRDGMRPSGGSMTSDVRRVSMTESPRSNQNVL